MMASDSMPNMPAQVGNNFYVAIQCENADETDKYFNALNDGAIVAMPLQETFWAHRFGLLRDKFGVNWMFNYGKPQPTR